MLTCISCSRQRLEDGEEDAARRGTPSTKDAVKSLTSQIKDIALKVSGSRRGGSSGWGRQRSYRDFDSDNLDRVVVLPWQTGSSSSSANNTITSANTINHAAIMHSESRSSCADVHDRAVEDEEAETREWMAQVEPGVQITFVSLHRGGNDLRRIRFSRELFNKWEAQRWWGQNYDRIMELYNVQRFNQQAHYNTTGIISDDGRDSNYSRIGSTSDNSPRTLHRGEWGRRFAAHHHHPKGGGCEEPSRTTTSSRDEASVVSVSNASEGETTEWVEEDEPGVYITVRQLVDGTRELRRVRFSRERFGEVHAKLWWETNRHRIQSQYL
ncbi:hypothetical protein M569_11467, partial [Genlisea aurea]